MPVDIVVPVLGESVSEATVAKWLKAAGDTVAADEPLVELETDKVTLEINAPAAGTLGEIVAAKGANVKVGQVLGRVEGEAGSVAKKAAPVSAPEVKAPPVAPATPTPGPAARKALAESGLSPAGVPGSGKDGRVTKQDVVVARAVPPVPVILPASAKEREERVPVTRLRQRIAQRLKEAQNTAAILTTFNEVDMSHLIALRNAYKDGFEKKHGVKLGFMSFFTKAAIQALKEIPAINAELDGDTIIYKNHYDIGVAVGTPNGLVVPVVRDADRLTFAEVEKKIGDYGAKARDGRLTIEDMTGGTFTISNGGVYGSLMSTPILNPPQSGILGMHKTQDRPVVVNGQIVPRPMMYLALSYDHRLIDGREAVTFLVRIKELIEDPQRLLLEV